MSRITLAALQTEQANVDPASKIDRHKLNTLEALKEQVATEGVNMAMMELVEHLVPGSLSAHSPLNTFTVAISIVNKDYALESLDTAIKSLYV